MKLKEKLAEEYLNKQFVFNNFSSSELFFAFLAGFEQARDMATERVFTDTITGRYSKHEIEIMGEEEV